MSWIYQNAYIKRVKGHYQDIKNYKPSDPDKHKSGTRLSGHIGELKAEKIPYRLEWSIKKEVKAAYNPVTNFCKLCTMEKYFILFDPDDATLNLSQSSSPTVGTGNKVEKVKLCIVKTSYL